MNARRHALVVLTLAILCCSGARAQRAHDCHEAATVLLDHAYRAMEFSSQQPDFPGVVQFYNSPSDVKRADRKLARAIRGYWRSKPGILICSLPELAAAYPDEPLDVRWIIQDATYEILGMTYEVENSIGSTEAPVLRMFLSETDPDVAPFALRNLTTVYQEVRPSRLDIVVEKLERHWARCELVRKGVELLGLIADQNPELLDKCYEHLTSLVETRPCEEAAISFALNFLTFRDHDPARVDDLVLRIAREELANGGGGALEVILRRYRMSGIRPRGLRPIIDGALMANDVWSACGAVRFLEDLAGSDVELSYPAAELDHACIGYAIAGSHPDVEQLLEEARRFWGARKDSEKPTSETEQSPGVKRTSETAVPKKP